MYRDIGIDAWEYSVDWVDRARAHVARMRAERQFEWFAAEDDCGFAGCAGGNLHVVYPEIFDSDVRRFGVVWGVYVRPEHTRRGLGRLLTQTVMDYLYGISCVKVRLHASPQGKVMYVAMGFVPSNELEIEVSPSVGVE